MMNMVATIHHNSVMLARHDLCFGFWMHEIKSVDYVSP